MPVRIRVRSGQLLRALPEQQHQPCGHQHQRRDQQNDVAGGEIVGDRVQPRFKHRQIRHGEGRHTVEEDEPVHAAADQPQEGHQCAPERPPPQKKGGAERQQYNQEIHQKCQRFLRHKAPKAGGPICEALVIEQLHHDGDR